MKIAVTSYSYGQVLGADFTIFDAMKHAKKAGMEGFEFAGFKTPEGKTAIEQAEILRDFAASIDLPLVCYAIGANFSADDLDAEVERTCRQVDIAAALGVPVMRHDVGWGVPDWYDGVKTFDAILPRFAEGCRRVTEYAAKLGIKTCSENHGLFVQDADRVVRLVEAVNHKNYGVLCDMGNFMCADDDPAIAVGKVAPITFHAHAKDFLVKSGKEINPGDGWFRSRAGNYLRGTIVGHGEAAIAQSVGILKKAGYTGYLSVEFEGYERAIGAIETGAQNLRRFIEMY